MKQKPQFKISLAIVLAICAALFFGFFSYLGHNFLNLGDTSMSILYSIVASLILLSLALVPKIMKQAKGNSLHNFIGEVTALIIFILVSIFLAGSSFNHFFAVSAGKQDIQNKILHHISKTKDIYPNYENYTAERESIFLENIESVVASASTNSSAFLSAGFQEGKNIKDQIDRKTFSLHAKLYPSNYNAKKDNNLTWLKQAEEIVNQWNWISIIEISTKLQDNSNQWLNELVELSRYREQAEQTSDFVYSIEDLKIKKDFQNKQFLNLYGILLAVILYIIMLLPYIAAPRRGPGIAELLGFKEIEGYTI